MIVFHDKGNIQEGDQKTEVGEVFLGDQMADIVEVILGDQMPGIVEVILGDQMVGIVEVTGVIEVMIEEKEKEDRIVEIGDTVHMIEEAIGEDVKNILLVDIVLEKEGGEIGNHRIKIEKNLQVGKFGIQIVKRRCKM